MTRASNVCGVKEKGNRSYQIYDVSRQALACPRDPGTLPQVSLAGFTKAAGASRHLAWKLSKQIEIQWKLLSFSWSKHPRTTTTTKAALKALALDLSIAGASAGKPERVSQEGVGGRPPRGARRARAASWRVQARACVPRVESSLASCSRPFPL